MRAVENIRSDFIAAVRRKTVQKHSVWRGLRHQLGVHLIRLERGGSHLLLGFKTHAGPGIGVDALRAGDGFAGVGQQFNFGASFARGAFGFGDHFGGGSVVGGSGDAQIDAEARREKKKRVTNVVAVADVGKFESAEGAELFFEGEKIGEGLARMKFIGERVDHRNAGVGGHFLENALFVNARDDAVNPAFEIASDVGDGFAFAEAGLGVVEKNDVATHALNADFKGDTSAERGLFKNEREDFVAQAGGLARGLGFDVRGELKEVARVRGIPFSAGEEIVGKQNGYGERASGHQFTFPPREQPATETGNLLQKVQQFFAEPWQ